LLDIVLASAAVASAITITQIEQRPHQFKNLYGFGVVKTLPCGRCGVKHEEFEALPRPCLELSARVEQDSD
jgi:hypothetical protein